MTKIPMIFFAMLSVCLYPGDALAGEVTTECPRTKPGHPEVAFRYGEAWPEGIPQAGGADEYEERDGLLYSKNIYSGRPLYNSFIVCKYRDGSKIEVPVPGRLLHCGMAIREISRKAPVEKEWLRVWCI